jgi:hypothetical protein
LNGTETILTTATGKYISKAFRRPHYQAVQFNPVSEFLVTQIPVHNLESLNQLSGRDREFNLNDNVRRSFLAFMLQSFYLKEFCKINGTHLR